MWGRGDGVPAAVLPAVAAAVVVALFVLARDRTLAVSAVAAGLMASLVAAVVAVASGGTVRERAGVALVAGAAAATVWAAGRHRRRVRADRDAERAARSVDGALAAFAVAEERRRLAAHLHDVVAHRLTGVAVACAAARRLADPPRREAALRHAVDAGERAVDELDALLQPAQQADGGDLDRLVAEHGAVRYHRDTGTVPGGVLAVAHRVVREALTNTVRHARGAEVDVRLAVQDGRLVVLVEDDGGDSGPDLGAGLGLKGLRGLVEEAGGRFTAGPGAGRGWVVRAELPLPGDAPPAPWSRHRTGAAARDRALVVVAFGVSAGVVLLPGAGDPDLLAAPVPATLLLTLLALHALPLAWRRVAPGRALVAAVAVQAVLVGCAAAGVLPLDPAEAYLWTWWVELALVTTAGIASAALAGGAMLAAGDGIHGNRAAAALVLAALLLVPFGAAWLAGHRAGRLRSRRLMRHGARHTAAEAAGAAERDRLAATLRGSAHAHTTAMLAAARAGDLDTVHTQARAGLTVLRDLVGTDTDPDAPPGIAGIRAAAARWHSTVRVAGAVRVLPAPVEVAAQRAVEALLSDRAEITVTYLDDGLSITIRAAGAQPAAVRRARHAVDAAGGAVTGGGADGTVRLWLPEDLR